MNKELWRNRIKQCYCIIALNNETKEISTMYSIGYELTVIEETLKRENFIKIKIFKISYEIYCNNATEIEFGQQYHSYDIEEILKDDVNDKYISVSMKYTNLMYYINSSNFWFEDKKITLSDFKKYNYLNYKRALKDFIR